MSNGLYFALNPGAILRRMFPKQLKSPLMIIIWTVIFILNIAAVVLIQNTLIYNITDFSKSALQTHSYFENYEILSVDELVDCYVTYQNEEGETRVARLERFPVRVFERARLDKSYDKPLMEDGSIEVKASALGTLFGSSQGAVILIGIYLVLAVIMLLIEFFLYEVFYRLFRE